MELLRQEGEHLATEVSTKDREMCGGLELTRNLPSFILPSRKFSLPQQNIQEMILSDGPGFTVLRKPETLNHSNDL